MTKNSHFTKWLKMPIKLQTKIIQGHPKMPSIPQKEVSETEQYSKVDNSQQQKFINNRKWKTGEIAH